MESYANSYMFFYTVSFSVASKSMVVFFKI